MSAFSLGVWLIILAGIGIILINLYNDKSRTLNYLYDIESIVATNNGENISRETIYLTKRVMRKLPVDELSGIYPTDADMIQIGYHFISGGYFEVDAYADHITTLYIPRWRTDGKCCYDDEEEKSFHKNELYAFKEYVNDVFARKDLI